MFVRLILITILLQVLTSSFGEVVIERARMQHYMLVEDDKIIRHVQGDDLQDSDLNGKGALHENFGQNVPEYISRSQSRNAINTERCPPGNWRDYWGRCRELY